MAVVVAVAAACASILLASMAFAAAVTSASTALLAMPARAASKDASVGGGALPDAAWGIGGRLVVGCDCGVLGINLRLNVGDLRIESRLLFGREASRGDRVEVGELLSEAGELALVGGQLGVCRVELGLRVLGRAQRRNPSARNSASFPGC